MISLNIFANCCKDSPDTKIIREAYKSFVDTFGEIETTIYLDPNPHPERYEEYSNNLKDFNIIKTSGLADGYIRSIENSTQPYLFQLEYDWKFQNIKHSLKEITDLMNRHLICHFRFSKNRITPENAINKWCSTAIQVEAEIPYIRTDNMSNNPHIIDRLFYLQNMMDKIERKVASHGIEENLTRKEFASCVYGRFGDEPTIVHLTPLTKK
jgi:hypothetical protein